MKFCSECGGKFGRHKTTKLVCNPNLAKIVNDDDPKGRAGEAGNPERMRCLEEQCNPSAFPIKGLQLLCIDGNEGMDDDPHHIALGFVVHEVINIMETHGDLPRGEDINTLRALFDQCETLAAMLGIDRRPQLYLHTSCG